MTILVTGCAGFIGSNFCRQFRIKYPKSIIVGLDDLSTGRIKEVDPSVIFYKGSIVDSKVLDKIFNKHKIDYVFNFAALPRVSYSVLYPVETSEVNILGTIALLQKCKEYKIKRFIHSSSSSVYGGAKILPTKESENTPDPKSPYAAQKYTNEVFCKIFSDLFGLETVCLRYFNVFGPGQYGDSPYSTVISAWLESLYFPSGKNPFIEGKGDQSRDFCYVDNVVYANICAMNTKNKILGDVFNVAHGERHSVNKIKRMIEELTQRKLSLEKRSKRIGDVLHTHADISKARRILGYKPAVNFEDGLKNTIEWFEKRIGKNK